MAAQVGAARPQHPVQAFAERRRADLLGVARAHGRDRVGRDEAGLQEVDVAVELEGLGGEEASIQVEEMPIGSPETALVGEVVHGDDRARRGQLGIEVATGGEKGRDEARLPVVHVHHVRRRRGGAQPLERGAAEEDEALRVVHIVAPPFAVHPGAVEVGRRIDEQRRHRGGLDGEDRCLFHRTRDRSPHGAEPARPRCDPVRGAIAGDDDRDLGPATGQRWRQRGDDVPQSPRLGVR